MNNPTQEQLHTLRHMLGINTPWDREPQPYRNYAAVGTSGEQHDQFVVMEELGFVEKYHSVYDGILDPTDFWRCTDKGTHLALDSHKDIRFSKPKRRYLAYSNLLDVYPDLTFKEFLTDDRFASIRQKA